MKLKHHILLAATLGAALLASSAQAQFQWAKRIASTVNPDTELSIGMTLDSQGNAYVTGWFDGTNDFGGVVLTNRGAGGQDLFVAKYDPSGGLQWARRAGSATAYRNMGRGVGVDTTGNVYVTGGFRGSADFGANVVSAPQNTEFCLAKYNSAGTVQWVRQSTGGTSDGVYGTGLAVDSTGNSYAVGFADNGATITFGTVNLLNTNLSGYSTFLVKYDNAGTLQWAQLLSGPGHIYATKVAVDSAGNVYVRGSFTVSVKIGASTLVSAGPSDMFLAKFDNTGALTWARQAGGTASVDEGGVAVDQAGNVCVTGWFGGGPIAFGGLSLTNAGSYDAFVARYSSAGAVQWARRAGGQNADVYWDVAVDGQGNAYAAGALGADAVAPNGTGGALVAKYDPAGTFQWANSASGPPASPFPSIVAKCAVDAAGNSYLAGWYQTATTFGTNVLQPKGSWSYFLAKLPSGTAPPTNAPAITSQPASRTNFVGTTATFTVAATGSAPLAYQWRYNGTNLLNGGTLSGVTTTNLTMANVQLSNGGIYSATVTNTYGSVTSAPAMLTVGLPPQLQITRSGSQVLLFWLTNAPDFVVETCSNLSAGAVWRVVTNGVMIANNRCWVTNQPASNPAFYRLRQPTNSPTPAGMALILAGPFAMGNTFPGEGYSSELPLHTNTISAFYMDKFDVTKALWDEVRVWALTNGYSFDYAGSGKGTNHPVQSVNWYDAVKWCNARSEKAGLVPAYYTSGAQTTIYRTGQNDLTNGCVKWTASGYRLPTEAEWEKAARGGVSGQRFPWGNTITHSNANYDSYSWYAYDVSPTRGEHPTFATGAIPYTSPVDYFAPNGYGLHDMAGNVLQWCWDWYGGYSAAPATDPRGPSGVVSYRVLRGGCWGNYADGSRCAYRNYGLPCNAGSAVGFRCVRGL